PPMPLSVDYRSPVSHFVPPAVELYANRHKPEIHVASSASETTPPKRKRGRPRVDKTSPEYLANLAARKQAREMAAVMGESGEKRKRGRPRVDKTAPEYLARKRAREIEALEKKAKKEYRRRTTGAKVTKSNTGTRVKTIAASKISVRKMSSKMASKMTAKMATKMAVRNVDKKIVIRRKTKFLKVKDSAASSSAGESTPRVKRKYTKRAPGTKKESVSRLEMK
ncbi:hypothetical protein KGM_200153B, partial [Danaus plexippus plexippus]